MRHTILFSSLMISLALAACGGSNDSAKSANDSQHSADKANEAADKSAAKADEAADKANDANKAEKENDSH